jgi:hypothetical protein
MIRVPNDFLGNRQGFLGTEAFLGKAGRGSRRAVSSMRVPTSRLNRIFDLPRFGRPTTNCRATHRSSRHVRANYLAILATLAALQTKSLFFRGLVKMANLAILAILITSLANQVNQNEAPQANHRHSMIGLLLLLNCQRTNRTTIATPP